MNTWEQFLLVYNRGSEKEMMFSSEGERCSSSATLGFRKKRRRSVTGLPFTSAHLALISHYRSPHARTAEVQEVVSCHKPGRRRSGTDSELTNSVSL